MTLFRSVPQLASATDLDADFPAPVSWPPPPWRPMHELPDGHGSVLVATNWGEVTEQYDTWRDDDDRIGRVAWCPLPAHPGPNPEGEA